MPKRLILEFPNQEHMTVFLELLQEQMGDMCAVEKLTEFPPQVRTDVSAVDGVFEVRMNYVQEEPDHDDHQ